MCIKLKVEFSQTKGNLDTWKGDWEQTYSCELSVVKNQNVYLKQQLSNSGFKNVHTRANLETTIKQLEGQRDEIDELRVAIELLELKGIDGHNACPLPLIQFNMFFL